MTYYIYNSRNKLLIPFTDGGVIPNMTGNEFLPQYRRP